MGEENASRKVALECSEDVSESMKTIPSIASPPGDFEISSRSIKLVLVRLLLLGMLICVYLYMHNGYRKIAQPDITYVEPSNRISTASDSIQGASSFVSNSQFTIRTVSSSTSAAISSQYTGTTLMTSIRPPSSLPTTQSQPSSSTDTNKIEPEPQLGAPAITSTITTTSTTPKILSPDGKMSLAFAVPSLIVAVTAVWIAWRTLAWMKIQQEVAQRQVVALMNVQINLELMRS